jgi:hypothetical protein
MKYSKVKTARNELSSFLNKDFADFSPSNPTTFHFACVGIYNLYIALLDSKSDMCMGFSYDGDKAVLSTFSQFKSKIDDILYSCLSHESEQDFDDITLITSSATMLAAYKNWFNEAEDSFLEIGLAHAEEWAADSCYPPRESYTTDVSETPIDHSSQGNVHHTEL